MTSASDEYDTAESASFSDPPYSPPPYFFTTTEAQPPDDTTTRFCVLRPMTFLPRQPPAPMTASPYRSPSPPPSCGCCKLMLGMAVVKGPKILC
jgi:hypothetical protein